MMNKKHVKTFLIWMALLNWPPVLIWIPFCRLPFFLGFLLWINVPVQRFGLAKLMGGAHYRIQEFGAMPQTTFSWILIAAFWFLAAIALTALTAMFSAMSNHKRKENTKTNLVRVCSDEHISEVARLAREIWQEHYVSIIGRKQVEYMLEKFQSEQAIREQLAGGYEYYIAAHDGRNEGYMAVMPNIREATLMMSKIYVRKSARGCGIGRKMLAFAEDLCRRRSIKAICLTVNKNNSHSIQWYSRMGFVNTGPTIQDIGAGFVMDDYRMEKIITTTPSGSATTGRTS